MNDLTLVLFFNIKDKTFFVSPITDDEIYERTDTVDFMNDEIFNFIPSHLHIIAAELNRLKPELLGGYNAHGVPCFYLADDSLEDRILSTLKSIGN